MASTTPLPTLLKSLNIGAGRQLNGETSQNAASSSQVGPKLSLTDQLHLLSAHIDTLEKSIQATVSSAEGKRKIQTQCADALKLKGRINDVNARVRNLEDGTDHDNNQDKIVVLECLAQYISARRAHGKERRVLDVARLIKDALLAVEDLESRLRNGQLEAEGLTRAVERVDRSASLLGIGSSKAPLIEPNTATSSSTWLADGGRISSVAIRDLIARIELAKDEIKKELLQRWTNCIRIDSSSNTLSLRVNDESTPLSLAQLMPILHSRSELQDLMDKLAGDIVALIIEPLLSSHSASHHYQYDVKSWSVERQRKADASDSPDEALHSVCGLLDLVRTQILSQAPLDLQITPSFSKKVVPTLIRSATKYMRLSLPKGLRKPISNATLPLLATISQRGKDIYDSLLQGKYLEQDLQDEGEELLQWSGEVHRHYMKNLATTYRRRARELLLDEAKGGWKAVTVKLDDEGEAIQSMLMKNPTPKEDFANVANIDKVSLEQNGDDIWASWDTEQPTADAIDLTRTSSMNASKQRQKKSALGGRRVIRPQDELGSGPFPETDRGDDVSWGFDDHLDAESSNTTAEAMSRNKYDALMKGLDEEEDVDEDAWGLTDEEKMERAAKRASARGDMAAAFEAYQAKQDKQAVTEPIVEGGDDEDDAWGLSAQEKEAVRKKRQCIVPPTAHPLDSFAVSGERLNDDGDGDEDAWGLNEEEQVAIARKRQGIALSEEASEAAKMSKSPVREGDRKQTNEDKEGDQSQFGNPSHLDSSSLIDASSVLSKDSDLQQFGKEDEEVAWGFNESDIDPISDLHQAIPSGNNADFPEKTSMSSDRGDPYSGTPKTSATSSSFTRTLQPLDMEGDESVATEDHVGRETPEEPLEDAWDLRDEVASVSEGAATGDSRGGKSSGSGEKLSDTTTEPWEEVSASAASLPTEGSTAPVSASTVGEWGWTEDDAVSAVVATGVGVGATTAVAAQMPRSASRSQSPHLATSSSPRKYESPRSRQAALRDSQDTSIGRSSSKEKSPVPRLASPLRKEKAVISQRSIDLIDLIKEILLDVEAIAKEEKHEALPPSYLINCISDILDMHRALLPVGHAETLATVPSLGMQFANDCIYIGKELKRMQSIFDSIQAKLGGAADAFNLDLRKQAQLTIDLGKRSFEGQLLLQHKILLECLMEAKGFATTHEENHFKVCQRSLKQVDFILNQLQGAWKPVLTRSKYFAAMGTLIDAVLRKVLMDIEAIEDISEVESEKLASLIKTLGELEFLFREDGQSQDQQSIVALYVPSWFKASYLTEILTGSLVDIEFLYFEAGALVDYSKAEIIGLVRSLFADTPKRSRLIDRIHSS